MIATTKGHWEQIYRHSPGEWVSWHEPVPALSLELIRRTGIPVDAPLIDVGGGVSLLVDHLLSSGFTDLTVLDISEVSLQAARTRLGAEADRVEWINADITRWRPPRPYALWHDRAVFHFLTDVSDRASYLRTLQACLPTSAFAIIATFNLDGPERCSGLPVRRYSPETLSAEVGGEFERIADRIRQHRTPAGRVQDFQYSLFRRVQARQEPPTG